MTQQGEDTISDLAKVMKDRASAEEPYTPEEVQGIVSSLQSLLPDDEMKGSIDMDQLSSLLNSVAHLSHKQWDRTGKSSAALQDILLPDDKKEKEDGGGGPLPPAFVSVMERVLNEGNWNGAADAASASSNTNNKPWAILVTGVNGIRKTTSVYQPWFPSLLSEAIVSPKGNSTAMGDWILPTGHNSFFRQLDHMIAILVNTEFAKLYSMASALTDTDTTTTAIPSTVIDAYARLKDAIFTRYRTLAEMLGILLLRQAMQRNMNVMIETSGRDVAMFNYVERFFPSDQYNKLALHFTINDITHAEQSVDRRMTEEIVEGMAAVKTDTSSTNVRNIVYANKGGPYGSEVLRGVQADSDRVWVEKVIGDEGVGESWYKAEILIEGSDVEDWKAMALIRDEKGDISKGTVHTFERRA